MSEHGAGDRWLAGESVAGVAFMHHQVVEIVGGSRDGARGRVLLLVALTPEPVYLVTLEDGSGELRVRQSALRVAAPGR